MELLYHAVYRAHALAERPQLPQTPCAEVTYSCPSILAFFSIATRGSVATDLADAVCFHMLCVRFDASGYVGVDSRSLQPSIFNTQHIP
jgi:hypothetical protein